MTLAHVIACFALIFFVLIQSSRGAGLGVAFGGSDSFLGGAINRELRRNTWICAGVLFVTAMLLGLLPSLQRKQQMRERLGQPSLPPITAPLESGQQPADTEPGVPEL